MAGFGPIALRLQSFLIPPISWKKLISKEQMSKSINIRFDLRGTLKHTKKRRDFVPYEIIFPVRNHFLEGSLTTDCSLPTGGSADTLKLICHKVIPPRGFPGQSWTTTETWSVRTPMLAAQQQGEAWFEFRTFHCPLVDTRCNNLKHAATILYNFVLVNIYDLSTF